MLKLLKRRDLIRRFRRLGFEGPWSGARHAFMVRGALKIRIPNPHGGDIGIALLREILRQAGIAPNDWD
ncbi:MAG: type II toxin-antitoxin system HicA family toxin [Elusimicrobia bacterium]|nr:type II toxin-antitoxin system HicA family toxin [Elusimicrobiota bacterium]